MKLERFKTWWKLTAEYYKRGFFLKLGIQVDILEKSVKSLLLGLLWFILSVFGIVYVLVFEPILTVLFSPLAVFFSTFDRYK